MSIAVSVIITNWNGLHHLPTCLQAALGQTQPGYEVVLVDNGSTDGSLEYAAEHYPQVRLVPSAVNLGFAAGTSLGIRHARGEYLATLNNDTEVEPRWLEQLVKGMEFASEVGMVASKMLFYHQREIINSAGIAVDRAGMAWDRLGGTADHLEGQPYKVFGPCAGAALYRRTMLDEIGLFDQDYFNYLEDVDLAWRANSTGWQCLYVPSARVYHVHSGSGLAAAPLQSYLLGRNKWWTIFKNYPWPELATRSMLLLAYDLMALAHTLVIGKTGHGVRGRLAAFKALPAMLSKRRVIHSLPGYSSRLAFDCLSPIDSPLTTWRRYRHLPTKPQEPIRSTR